jgi:hypothetical protein
MPTHPKRSTGLKLKQSVCRRTPDADQFPPRGLRRTPKHRQTGGRIVRQEVRRQPGCDESTFVATRYPRLVLKPQKPRAADTRSARTDDFTTCRFVNREVDSLFCVKLFPVLLCGISEAQRACGTSLKQIFLSSADRYSTLRPNSLHFSLLAGNFSGEGFAPDCVLRQQVVTVREVTSLTAKNIAFGRIPRTIAPESVAEKSRSDLFWRKSPRFL